MEARATRLEAGVSDIRATLARLEPVLGQVSKELGQVSKDLVDVKAKDLVDLKVGLAKPEGRVSQLPTTIQTIGFISAVLAVAGGTRHLGIWPAPAASPGVASSALVL